MRDRVAICGASGDELRDGVLGHGTEVPCVHSHVDLSAALAPFLVDMAVQQPAAVVAGPVIEVLEVVGVVEPVREVVDAHLLAADPHRLGRIDDPFEAAELEVVAAAGLVLVAACPAAVVVAGHEDLATPQPRHMLGEDGVQVAERDVADHPHLVVICDEVVPPLDHRVVHLVHVGERPAAVADDVAMPEMMI